MKQNNKNYQIKTKPNGDIYNYDPIKGYETEFAKPYVFSKDSSTDETLDEKFKGQCPFLIFMDGL